MDVVRYKPIGVVRSPFKKRDDVPKQSAGLKDVEGAVEVLQEYSEGLKDIEGFSHIILVFHFHLSRGRPLLVKPYWDDSLRGVFASRSPDRPNPIGWSIVRLTGREGKTLYIRGADMVDGTPVLDIKPFIARFDNKRGSRAGWLERHLEDCGEKM